MVFYRLNGIDVYFPFDVYPGQLQYMHLLLDCFQRSQNGLLESPTGTGKTLSILCASLAWLNQNSESRRVKLYYASRTHSQLAQVAAHLKPLLASHFKNMRMCILGSRDQMCVHPIVSKKPAGYPRVVACRALIKRGGCRYYCNSTTSAATRASNKKSDHADNIPNFVDIEDLLRLGEQQQFCPYYVSTGELYPKADIILLPYNYILEPRLRRIHNINLKGGIIALDEAHNIEDVCEDACSAELKIKDLQKVIEASSLELTGVSESVDAEIVSLVSDTVRTCLRSLMNSLRGLTTDKRLPGQVLVNLFQESELGAGVLEKLDQWNPKDDNLCGCLHRVSCFLESVIASRNVSTSYCVLYSEDTVSYYCLTPALAINGINCARSVILTSGTLGCFQSLELRLGIPFQVKHRFDHILEADRLLVLPMASGPDGSELRFSFSSRSRKDVFVSLGRAIVNVSRICPGGLLLFFSSYQMLRLATTTWTSTHSGGGSKTLWQCLSNVKPIFVESRNAAEFEETIGAYRESALKSRGAIFLAVVRGRASEGMDFTGDHARTVIVVGLPYAPRFDHKLQAKMQLLDQRRSTDGISGQIWYESQMYKAVGQAVGRLIRSKDDYGVLVLLDCRFSAPSVQANLPPWIRRSIRRVEAFADAMRMIKTFFLDARKWRSVQDEATNRTETPDNDSDCIVCCDTGPQSGGLPAKAVESRPAELPSANDVYDNSSLFRKRTDSAGSDSCHLLKLLRTEEANKRPAQRPIAGTKDESLSFEQVVTQRRIQLKARRASASLLSQAKNLLSSEKFQGLTVALTEYHRNDSSKYETFQQFRDRIFAIFKPDNKDFIPKFKPFILAHFRQEFDKSLCAD